MSANPYRQLPAVNVVLEHPQLAAALADHPHERISRAVRAELDRLREQLKSGASVESAGSVDAIVARTLQALDAEAAPMMRAVINATGIVLHTNLGRAPIPAAAAEAARSAAAGYLNLELDLGNGRRSSRQNPIRGALLPILGCESATVVNNCAAATVITLRAMAAGKEVIVSRGQLVEIGGSFRVPEIMAVSGAKLREVGTTNITRIGDYEKALTAETALLMRIHCSNYRIGGFTESAGLEELVDLGRRKGIPVVDDIGSGAMLDFARFGLPGDPVVGASLQAGADLVLFSGDKLLGGPQAGLILGRREYVSRIEKDPLMRAFRLDKMTLAALESVLKLYRDPERAVREVPILRMLNLKPAELRPRAEAVAVRLRSIPGAFVDVRDDSAFVGGGSLPDLPLPTVVVSLRHPDRSDAEIAERLRLGRPAVMARIRDGEVLFDLRTVFPEQEWMLIEAVRRAVTGE